MVALPKMRHRDASTVATRARQLAARTPTVRKSERDSRRVQLFATVVDNWVAVTERAAPFDAARVGLARERIEAVDDGLPHRRPRCEAQRGTSQARAGCGGGCHQTHSGWDPGNVQLERYVLRGVPRSSAASQPS